MMLSEVPFEEIRLGQLVMVPMSSMSSAIGEIVGVDEKNRTITVEVEGLLMGNRKINVKHTEAIDIVFCNP